MGLHISGSSISSEIDKIKTGSSPGSPVKEPTVEDIIVAFPTTPGYVSFRNTTRGSPFIETLCTVGFDILTK